jgi:hypothetical protein
MAMTDGYPQNLYFIFWINMRFGPKASGIPGIPIKVAFLNEQTILGCRLFHWFTPWNWSKAL